MHFESLNIRGFGCLRTNVKFAPDKLNLAVADNESGKSTLIAALLAAFYGVVDDLRDKRDKRPHRRNVTPWTTPEQFGLELDFTAENRRWRIQRDFGTGEVHLIDRETGRDHAADHHRGRGAYNFGENLIGLPVDEFLKSFYLRQEEILELRESQGLTHYIQGVATALEGGMSSELALQRLRDARENYPFSGASREALKIENAIKRLQTERDNCLQEMEKLDRGRSEIEPDTQRLSIIEADIARLRVDREGAIRSGDLAEARELKRLIEAQERLKGEFDSLSKTSEELRGFEDFPASKSEQLNNLAGRVSELSGSVAKFEARLKEEADDPLAKVEQDLQDHRSLAGVVEADTRAFETALSRAGDRRDRAHQASSKRDRILEDLKASGHDRDKFNRLNGIFAGISPEEKHFIEGFRANYAEEEVTYREAKTKREWHERERALIVSRRQKVIGTARFFFLLCAVTVIAGGAFILLTQGEWIGKILAGLGIVFGAVGAITRGTASGSDAATLRKLEADLGDTVRQEEDARIKLERVGRDLTELAGRIGYAGGHELLADYLAFDDMRDRITPLLDAEREVVASQRELHEAMEQLAPFFARAGESFPSDETAYDAARSLLERYRHVMKIGEELLTIKRRKADIETELGRLRRDFDSNRQLCEDILRMGGIAVTHPLDEAVKAFGEALEKHRRYRAVATEQLPRARQELLAEVDFNAKRDRLKQLITKNGEPADDDQSHSKEFYRDRADALSRDEGKMREERESINRRIVSTYDRYQAQYPPLRRKVEELDDSIARAEAFRGEVDTAIFVMTNISREVYRSWAAALSEETTPFLEALNPRYSNLVFKEDLSFSVKDNVAGRTIQSAEAEAILSTGARDEVFLAARLGIACYLARGAKGAMPIVLDEPLAAVDDDKFVTGMRFFLDVLSQKHQILVMSCHDQRHKWLEDRIPDQFKDRVQRIELRSEG